MQTRASLVFASFLGLILPGSLACSKPAPEPAPSVAKAAAAHSETEAVAKQGTPKIAAPEPVFDFGTIKPKQTIEHVFTIKNEGDGDLHIDRVQKTWGCTATVVTADVIPPGGEGQIKMTLRPKGTKTNIKKGIVVHSDDPEQPKFTLTMTGKLLIDVVAVPAHVNISDLKAGEAGKAFFKLKLGEGSKAEIKSASIQDAENFSLRRVDADKADKAKDLLASYEVSFRGRDAVGTSATQIKIVTTGENTPEITLPVRASVAKNLRYQKNLRFARDGDNFKQRRIHISARHGEAPKIKKIEDPDGLLKIEVLKAHEALVSIRVDVLMDRWKALDEKAQRASHRLLVHTDDKEEPIVVFNYRTPPKSTKPSKSAVGKGRGKGKPNRGAEVIQATEYVPQ